MNDYMKIIYRKMVAVAIVASVHYVATCNHLFYRGYNSIYNDRRGGQP